MVVGPSQIGDIQEVDYGFLANNRRQIPLIEWENHWVARAKVQILFIQIFKIRRRE